jgi:hypothetical protein
VSRAAGDIADARVQYQRATDVFRALGDAMGVARSAIDLGHLACDEGALDVAHGLFGDALAAFVEAGHRPGVAVALEAFACAASAAGDIDRALTLAGAAANVRCRHVTGAPTVEPGTRLEPRVADLWARSDPEAAALRTAGAAMPVDRAIAYARQVPAEAGY